MYTELDNAGGLPCIIFTLQSTTIALLQAHSTTIDTQHLQLFHETCKLLYSLDVYGHIFNLVRDGVKPLYGKSQERVKSNSYDLFESTNAFQNCRFNVALHTKFRSDIT